MAVVFVFTGSGTTCHIHPRMLFFPPVGDNCASRWSAAVGRRVARSGGIKTTVGQLMIGPPIPEIP